MEVLLKVRVYNKALQSNSHKFIGEYLVSEKHLKAFKRQWSQGLFIVEPAIGVENNA